MATSTPRTTKPKAAPAPKPWRREDGRYRSADDRFTIEGGGAGRWFLTDEGSLDELGLARTIGPFDTLDDAKAAATAQREIAATESPLAARLAAAGERPAREQPRSRARGSAATAATAATPATPEKPARRMQAAETASLPPDGAPPDAPHRKDAPAPPPPPRTWLDELEAEDRQAARRASRLIDQLDALGVADAGAVVRRDVLGRQPAIAATLLGRSIADALRATLEPAALRRDARRAIAGPMRSLDGTDDSALAAYAAFIAGRVLAAALETVSQHDRADGAGRDLPGWQLMERPAGRDGDPAPRRLLVTPDDVAGS